MISDTLLLMSNLHDLARDLLDRYATDLSPEIVGQKRRLLAIGEQALVAQDMISFGLRRQDLDRSDLDTARRYADSGFFGPASAWFKQQIEQELSRIAA